ncbi:hypothetical protein BDV24DRAFT_133634 [Neofusicoccum parvum]|uniref:Uncharacterized protein n=1 Tax=Neofusicoccum parvum TaxID=310453 RepID=A0ACB5RT20_9PEZI|nr:hypothetical protein BDV24DRAFT_133634 [Neofusicoccum parvum]
MLERVGGDSVDFIVLERNADTHPQVGASIAFAGNALRIFDQLGCCDEILEKAGGQIDTVGGLSPDGKLTVEWMGASGKLVDRLGCPMVVLDRQVVLETLYNHVRDKSKILMNKRVVSVANLRIALSHFFKKWHYVGFLGMVGIMLNYQNAILQAPPCLH